MTVWILIACWPLLGTIGIFWPDDDPSYRGSRVGSYIITAGFLCIIAATILRFGFGW